VGALKFVGRFAALTVIDIEGFQSDPRNASHGRRSQMIELTVRLTEEQLAEIAERAAALIPAGTPIVSPWLNVVEAAERLRCRKDRIYDLIALGKLHPRRDGRRVLLHRDDLDSYVEGRTT
jgi:excisionase family DNA binding protein